jgi:hypothetical protein
MWQTSSSCIYMVPVPLAAQGNGVTQESVGNKRGAEGGAVVAMEGSRCGCIAFAWGS